MTPSMETRSLKKVTAIWVIAILVLFLASIILGILMRFNQGTVLKMGNDTFYATLTTHGVTMIGIWTAAGLVGINYLLGRYVKTSAGLSIFALILTVIGVVMLWMSTFAGNFHAAWTFLYPLPLFKAWDSWATPLFLYSLAVFGVAWLVWSVGMMVQILKKYSITEIFAWQHLSGKEPEKKTPPFILISSVSLIGIILSLIVAVILLVLFFAEIYSSGTFTNDSLLMKNLTFFFGHTIANEALYLGLALVYELLPEVSGRKRFETTWYVALGWNMTMIFVLTAFFHHMYMDFVQPGGFQVIGQLASYFASLPAAGVTAFSVATLVFRNRIKWTLTNLFFFIGITGWLIGGVGAVIDSTISNNIILHNTLWVPAHFHTYNAMGNVLLCMGFFWWVAHDIAGVTDSNKSHKLTLALLLIGGFGFVLMFYLGGAGSVPRRYALYPEGLSAGATYAAAAGWFATVYLVGMVMVFSTIVSRCTKAFSSAS
ncbi:MAG TPA: cbb3-type cytochrome c oxidase subunit I [Flavobacteriales bacterium]|nr:cbb3-type cytochrome c oxidase subunit I [Flavobacteriales bacterium]